MTHPIVRPSPIEPRVEAACRALCQSGKFETGQGTCAAICMEFLGNPRKQGCGHAVRVHGALAEAVLQAGETK